MASLDLVKNFAKEHDKLIKTNIVKHGLWERLNSACRVLGAGFRPPRGTTVQNKLKGEKGLWKVLCILCIVLSSDEVDAVLTVTDTTPAQLAAFLPKLRHLVNEVTATATVKKLRHVLTLVNDSLTIDDLNHSFQALNWPYFCVPNTKNGKLSKLLFHSSTDRVNIFRTARFKVRVALLVS